MKKAFLISISIIFLSLNTAAQSGNNINFTNAWTEVQQLVKSGKPKSALTKINEIEREAQRLDNRQQLLKVLIYRTGLQEQITKDIMQQTVSDYQQFKATASDSVEIALINSLIAGEFYNYYQQNIYRITQRTPLRNYIPENMDEWSENIFQDTIISLLKESLTPANLLQAAESTAYAEILELGKDSRTQRPTVFDLLSYRALELWPLQQEIITDNGLFRFYQDFIKLPPFSDEKLEIFRNLIAFHIRDSRPDALVMADMTRLDYLQQISSDTDSLCLENMDNLLRQFAEYPVSVEVIAIKARILLDNKRTNCREKDFDPSIPQTIYDMLQDGIRKFPNYTRINILKTMLSELKQKTVYISSNANFRTNEPIKIKLHYTNTTNPVITIWRYNMDPAAYAKANTEERNRQRKKELSRKLTLIPTNYYIPKDTVIELPALPYGIYALSVNDKDMKEQSSEFRVTNMLTIIRDNENNSSKEIMVLDNETGQPIPGVVAEFYQPYRKEKALTPLLSEETDKDGKISVKGKGVASLFIKNGDDQYAHKQYINLGYYGNEDTKEKTRYATFTDRAMYRPGQTVHFKTIVYNLTNKLNEVIPDKQITVSFRDADYKEIASLKLKTNEFGSAASSFIIPENVKSGNFTIAVDDGASATFSVEEYKRPTFEITMDKLTGTYSFGDEVTITGNVKSFMGLAVPDAKITYRIVSKPNFFWRIGIPFRQEKQVGNGELKSDETGKFSFSFTPEKDKKNGLKEDYYRYAVAVEVTDANGESQIAESSIYVGDRSMILSIEMDETYSDMFDKIPVTAKTLNGEPVNTSINYTVYSLNDIDRLDTEQPTDENTDLLKLTRKRHVASGTIQANKKEAISLKDISADWESGYYRFVISSEDDKGRTVTDSTQTILYKKGDTRPPVKTHLWTEVEKAELEYGDTASFRIGTSDVDVWLYYDVRYKNNTVTGKWIQLSNEIRSFSIPFEEKYGNALYIEFFFVKNGTFYRKNILFQKKQEKRALEPEFSTFRDKLQPGEKEEWTLKIPGLNGSAEVLAAMYDASLDKLRKNNWVFNTTYQESVYFPIWHNRFQQELNLYANSPMTHFNYQDLSYDKFFAQNNFRSLGFEEEEVIFLSYAPQEMSKKATATRLLQADAIFSNDAEMEMGIPDNPEETSEDEMDTENLNVRTNFAETAFFYPQLKTNANSEVLISFTIPESLTRWRFMGLAHTTDLFSGKIEKEVVTQKIFMIMPNLPRFLRQSDQCAITANVINNSDSTLKGKARIELLDPKTEKVLITKTTDFNLEAGKSQVVSWSILVPQNQDLVICRIVGTGGKTSDGEQKLLPILSDKVIITESMPMTIRSNETRTFTFDKFRNNNSHTLQSKLLKLEFSSSPIWYAIQALPSVSAQDNENIISTMAAYYGNTLAAYITRSNPRITSVIEAWKASGSTQETLLSNLRKNTELKNILLEETPWVLEAQDETEQKQRLSTLFDANTQQANRSAMMAKILEMQTHDGSFSWFPQMRGSRYITTYILNKMVRLVHIGAVQYNDNEKQMQLKAINYLDQQLQNDYVQVKKYSKDLSKSKINATQLYYYMMRSAYRDIPIYAGTTEANKFYYGLIKKQWTTFGLYEKAMAALTLYRNGDTETAREIINSLREFSITSDEMGMYWESNRSGYLWNESIIATHTAIMEAFATVDLKTEELDEMRIWLLKQKQTQQWESVPATVDAIYALLLQGSDWLSADNNVSVQMGGKTIQPENMEIGTGYFTKVFIGNEIKPNLGTVEIEKTGVGIAWGALYWQYEEKLEKVEKARTALHIEKKLMFEQVTKNGTELIPITEKTKLTIGDKIIVRLVIRTDRDMEYVALKDQRASCLEPATQISGYRYSEQISYYQSPKDASMQYFFDYLPKGTYVMEYPLWVTHAGEYTNGITTLQCLYAPEFVSHTESVTINVK
jgi:uncharacterized protein YfaS (alpha-2-macroglobulin family)